MDNIAVIKIEKNAFSDLLFAHHHQPLQSHVFIAFAFEFIIFNLHFLFMQSSIVLQYDVRYHQFQFYMYIVYIISINIHETANQPWKKTQPGKFVSLYMRASIIHCFSFVYRTIINKTNKIASFIVIIINISISIISLLPFALYYSVSPFWQMNKAQTLFLRFLTHYFYILFSQNERIFCCCSDCEKKRINTMNQIALVSLNARLQIKVVAKQQQQEQK